jgi:hypothetical protein
LEKSKKLFSLITIIFILTLTVNTIIVQAAAPSIDLKITGLGEVYVKGYTNKEKEINFGFFNTNTIVKITGNVAYVEFELVPDSGYHVSSVVQDGSYVPFGDVLVETDGGTFLYTLLVTSKNHLVEVTFSEEGTVIVPPNTEATLYLGSTASLTVDNTGNNDQITFLGTELEDPEAIVTWDITTDEITENVIIAMRFPYEGDPTGIVKIFRTNLEYPNADINEDNQITGEDVSAVANVNPGTGPDDPDWDPDLDINGDEVIDNLDVNIVSNYNPTETVWQDITIDYEDIGNGEWLVYGETDHFSIFRCR